MSALAYAETVAVGVMVISAAALTFVTWSCWSITRMMKDAADSWWAAASLASELRRAVREVRDAGAIDGLRDIQREMRRVHDAFSEWQSKNRSS